MPAIDSLLSYISQKRVPLTIISAGKPLQWYIDEAPVAGGIFSEDQIATMVREIAPPSLVGDEPFSFDYSVGPATYTLSGKIAGTNSQLEIRPAATPAPAVTSSFSIGAPSTAAETSPFVESTAPTPIPLQTTPQPAATTPAVENAAPVAATVVAPQPLHQQSPLMASPQDGWFYFANGAQQGPINGQALGEMLRTGQLPGNAMVWKYGLANWIPASQSEVWPQGMMPPIASATNYNPAYPQYNPQTVMTGDGTGGLIPYKNPQALTSYYVGLFSLVPCAGLAMGPFAVYMGIQGLKFAKANPIAKGQAHAWVGIICGGFWSLAYWGLLLSAIIGFAVSSSH